MIVLTNLSFLLCRGNEIFLTRGSLLNWHWILDWICSSSLHVTRVPGILFWEDAVLFLLAFLGCCLYWPLVGSQVEVSHCSWALKLLIYTCQEWLAILTLQGTDITYWFKGNLTYFESFQVLHLMNKMNLPPPFGPVTARPPMVTFLNICFQYCRIDSQFKMLAAW